MLTLGSVLGTFKILGPLGSGGMGEVWRARDMKLQREVAIKTLSEEFSRDADRVSRFRREAELLASLNHPNIAAIYDIVQDGGTPFIVLELVEGETLAERIRRGPVVIEDALAIAKQIAVAFEAAHEKGIVHRDLKPANIKITPEGKVKVLDFGLAKISGPSAATTSLSQSPTVVSGTGSGVILGTPAYLSPEQARGKPVDKRTDIWAFGCVLYEMLTGRQTFPGETISDLLAAILTRDVDWQALPNVPQKVRELLARCLQKDPNRRLRDFGDAGIIIEEAMTPQVQAPAPAAAVPKRPLAAIWVLAIAAALATGLAGMWFGEARRSPTPTWFGTQLGGPRIAMMPRVSPDGSRVAVHAMVDGQTQVAVIQPGSGDWTALTHDRTRGELVGISWSRDGTRIYYGRSNGAPSGVFSVPAVGGEERLVLEDAKSPEVLPDGSLLVIRLNEKAQYQIFRYWPENTRLQAYPGIITRFGWAAPRAFRDGKEAVFWGRSVEQPDSDPNDYLYALDLASASIRRISTDVVLPSQWALSVSIDDQAVLAVAKSGDLNTIVQIPRSGGAAREIGSTMTHQVWGIDVAANGDLYIDQANKFLEVVLMESDGGRPQTILTANTFEENISIPLPDGRMLFTGHVGGRSRLLAAKARGNPAPFVQTTEETSSPVTMVGSSEVAFLLGSPATRKVGIASAADGRILRRLDKADGSRIQALTASPDGRMLYYATAGKIWALPANDGEPQLIREGDGVAIDPGGQYLIVQLAEKDSLRLVRVPLQGGAQQPLSFPSVRIVGFINSNAVRADGAIIKPGASTDSYPWHPTVLFPGTGKAQRIPLPSFLDIFSTGWTAEGQIVAFGQQLNATIWHLRPNSVQKPTEN